MQKAYIFDAVRTPRGKGKPDGALHETTPVQLVVALLNALRERNNLDTSKVEDVILGCVTQMMEQGSNIAKVAAQTAGYADTVAGVTINRFCASGLEAVNQAAAQVMCGMASLVVAGGVESMSRCPMGSDGGAWYMDPAVAFPGFFIPQGISADLIATKYGFTRHDVDAFAVESQRRATKAQDEGRFRKSVVPVKDILGKVVLAHEETIRPNSTIEKLAQLEPAFRTIGKMAGFDNVAIQKYPEIEQINHVHHAGNSSGIVDGASAVLIGNEAIGKALGMKPKAVIRSFAITGTEPTIMLLGPAPSTRKALQMAGLRASDIDLFEVNEAFAAVVLRFIQDLGVSHDIVNVNGGAIAMGHPLGATGGMLVSLLLDEIERQDKSIGICTLCVGGGMGIATVFERL